MVVGIGIDSVEIARIGKLCGRKGFLERVFLDEEREAYAIRGHPPESLAGGFAAKEAVSKALGVPMSMSRLKQIEIKYNGGCPMAVLHGELKEIMRGKCAKNILISITHDKTYAIAVAVMEG